MNDSCNRKFVNLYSLIGLYKILIGIDIRWNYVSIILIINKNNFGIYVVKLVIF